MSALRAPMERVVSLQPELRAVAESMRELATLRDPLIHVAELREPMTRLAALNPITHPISFIALALLGLTARAAVTFVAVRFAVLSAMCRSRPR